MRIKTTISPTKKYIAFTALAVIILSVGAYAFYAYRQNNSIPTSSDTTNYEPATNDQQKAGDNIKKNSVDTDKSGQASSSPSSNSDAVVVTITSAIQNGNIMSIRSLIETVSNSGSCTIKLTKGAAVVTKTSGIQALANSSTCRGFDIPTSELSTGSWNVSLAVTIDSKTGSATKSISIQ